MSSIVPRGGRSRVELSAKPEGLGLRCPDCGEHTVIGLPSDVDRVAVLMRSFCDVHRRCPTMAAINSTVAAIDGRPESSGGGRS